ncbi:hypothetical protein ACEQ38_17040 [Ralstonia syzygii subsp. celebesensis]|uniref:Uncharacterized protein n=2 Tax=Ralstonia syzygii subsp. celebesensis TaxID=1310168 RepID=A0A1U9VPU9_9RALS|nr:hypothetical protein [Ralstonia syzygii]AQW32712.1 hypothetical protein B0B51_23325 [blood disease bacterium A2-HR MARDI]QQV57704.1 hypothetical protein JK151_19855 [Ralstonia syzygii subsp. celebesensis]CCA83778.1 conserved hypothetical protein, putative phage related protein [blood disease bacterium R229]
MPRITIDQTNFTAGEISPKVFGRVDVSRYQNGAESLENCVVNIHGGAQRRDGTLFVAAAKYTTHKSRLIPFVFSRTQAYMLEFGHLYVRFYLASGGQIVSGGVPYELPSPYTEDQVQVLDFAQGADTLLIFHENVPTYSLRRLASDSWTLQPAPFSVIPFDETGHRFATTLTLSDKTIGPGRTATAGTGVFFATDVGRRITAQGSGLAMITAYTNATTVTIEVQEGFGSTALSANAWLLEDTPQGSITPSAQKPVGTPVNLDFGAGVSGWRPEDVGKFVDINGGLVQITSFTSNTSVAGVIKKELTATVAAPANSWVLNGPVWNANDGYPRCGAFYEQRLIAAGSPRYPQTIWGSRTAIYFDFTQGTDDDEGFSFTLPATGEINPINRMTSSNVLIPFTNGAEFTLYGGVEKPLTPTNPQCKARSAFGTSDIKPVKIGTEILFVQRAGKKVRAVSYDPDTYSYKAPDLTVLAEHITRAGLKEIAYQQEPRSVLWGVRNDGVMTTLTFDRDEGVTAWTPQTTDGLYESVATLPNPDGNETWAIVQRTINGATKRYIERFDPTYYTDCAIKGTSALPTDVWAGLAHLEGKTVQVKADGTYVGEFTVIGGSVTLPRTASAVEIGLKFESRIKFLRPEIQTGEGSAQGNAMSTSEVTPLFLGTTGCLVDTGDLDPNYVEIEIPFRHFGEGLLDLPPDVVDGFDTIGVLGWQRGEAPLTLLQDQPYPFHVLALVRKFTVNS